MALALLSLVGTIPTPGRAEYPERPIRLLLPFPAGGAVDLVARLVTARMADDLGRAFVIENKSGAGGVIATDATAKARVDGDEMVGRALKSVDAGSTHATDCARDDDDVRGGTRSRSLILTL